MATWQNYITTTDPYGNEIQVPQAGAYAPNTYWNPYSPAPNVWYAPWPQPLATGTGGGGSSYAYDPSAGVEGYNPSPYQYQYPSYQAGIEGYNPSPYDPGLGQGVTGGYPDLGNGPTTAPPLSPGLLSQNYGNTGTYNPTAGSGWAQLDLQRAINEAQMAYNYARLRQESEQAAQQAALQAGSLELQRQMATGYVQSGAFNMGAMGGAGGTSRSQALKAIWDSRQDLRDNAQQNGYGGDWQTYMEKWLNFTTEPAKADPVAYALGQGYLQPPTAASQAMVPTLERQLGEGNLGLGYLQMLASQQGPQDWITYWNTQRNAQNTNLPAWASALATGLKLPAFGGATTPPAGYSSIAGRGGAPATGLPTWANLPSITPQSVSPQQWQSMNPSEQSGLQGMISAQGGFPNDWMKQMQAAWPTGNANMRTVWR